MVVHESTVWSVCGKVLGSVAAMKYHIEFVHLSLDQPQVQCKEWCMVSEENGDNRFFLFG